MSNRHESLVLHRRGRCSLVAARSRSPRPPFAQGRSTRSTRRWSSCSAPAASAALAVLRHRHPRLAGRLHPDRRQPHARHARPARPPVRRPALPARKVVVIEPELDVALVKIDQKLDEPLPYFDIAEAAKRAAGRSRATGSWPSATSSRSPRATSRCRCSAASSRPTPKLRGRRGVFEAPYQRRRLRHRRHHQQPRRRRRRRHRSQGRAARHHRQGAAEHADRHLDQLRRAGAGQGRGAAEGPEGEGERGRLRRQGDRRASTSRCRARSRPAGRGGFHGIVLVPNVVERTPPYVEEVRPGSPAAKAGLRPDDLIVYVDGELVASIKDFREIMKPAAPGTEVTLEVRRGDKLQTRQAEAGRAGRQEAQEAAESQRPSGVAEGRQPRIARMTRQDSRWLDPCIRVSVSSDRTTMDDANRSVDL